MGEEGLGKEVEVNKIMTVITKVECVVDSRGEIQEERCDGQTRGAAREQATEGETEKSSGLCPIVPANTSAANKDVFKSLNGEEAKENRDSTVAPENQQHKSKL